MIIQNTWSGPLNDSKQQFQKSIKKTTSAMVVKHSKNTSRRSIREKSNFIHPVMPGPLYFAFRQAILRPQTCSKASQEILPIPSSHNTMRERDTITIINDKNNHKDYNTSNHLVLSILRLKAWVMITGATTGRTKRIETDIGILYRAPTSSIFA